MRKRQLIAFLLVMCQVLTLVLTKCEAATVQHNMFDSRLTKGNSIDNELLETDNKTNYVVKHESGSAMRVDYYENSTLMNTTSINTESGECRTVVFDRNGNVKTISTSQVDCYEYGSEVADDTDEISGGTCLKAPTPPTSGSGYTYYGKQKTDYTYKGKILYGKLYYKAVAATR